MNKVAVVGTYELYPDNRDRVIRALLDHRDRCMTEEPGTLDFKVLVPAEDSSKIFLFELYADSLAFNTHLSGKSIAILREQIGSKIKSRSFHQCVLGDDALAP